MRGRRHQVRRRHDPVAVEGRQIPGLDRRGVRPGDLRRVPSRAMPSSSPRSSTCSARKLRLGLSATPGRADGKELLVQAHIGPIRASTEAALMVPKVLRFASDWQCPRVRALDPETRRERGRAAAARARQDDAYREDDRRRPGAQPHAGRLIFSAYEKGRQLVVFSTLHDHLHAVHRLCIKDFGISGRKMGFYVGACSRPRRSTASARR